MSKIQKTELGHLIEFQRGFDLPKTEFKNGNVPVISSNGILGYHNIVKVKAPGITIGRSGTVGLPHYIEVDFFPHNTALYVKDFKSNDPKYIYYLIKTLGLNDYKSGSGVPTMNRNHLHPLKVNAFLDTNYQKKIASVLSLLDSKIELNNRINAELEQMAKTIYDYWFVQFDFRISAEYAASVGQPELEGKPYKSSGGKMVWSDELKREVPEGWDVKKLQQIVSVKKDILQTNNLHKDTAYIGLEHIPRKSFNLSTWEIVNKIDSAKFKFEKHDILFGKIRPYFHKVGICLTSGITSVDCIVLRPKNKEYKGLILQTVFSDEFVDVATNSSTGSKMPRADWKILKDYFVIDPNVDLLIKFNNLSNNIFESMGSLVSENQKLTELRDWLLPMLMNGQVKVGENEADEISMAAEPQMKYGK